MKPWHGFYLRIVQDSGQMILYRVSWPPYKKITYFHFPLTLCDSILPLDLIPSWKLYICFSSVHLLSCVQFFATSWAAASQSSLPITNSQSLFSLTSIESLMASNHLILCHPLLLPPTLFTSIRIFIYELVLCNRWPKYYSFSFSISPSIRTEWLDLLAIHGTLKSLPRHHSSK